MTAWLHYDAATDRYIGQVLAVAGWQLRAAVDELVREGELAPAEAWAWLLDEGEWSPDIEGVEMLLSEELAIAEAERVVRRPTSGGWR